MRNRHGLDDFACMYRREPYTEGMVIDRTSKLTIRISEEELEMLRALADANGVTASDFLRLYVRKEYAEKFGDKKPKTH